MKIILIGYSGRMGRQITSNLNEDDSVVLGINSQNLNILTDKNLIVTADVIIDFSRADIINEVCMFAIRNHLPIVIGTTGFSPTQIVSIKAYAEQIPIFMAGNFSTGIGLILKNLRQIAKFYPNAKVDIVETHHKLKQDYPSGTALMLAETVKSARGGEIVTGASKNYRDNDINVHSIRYGEVTGIHKVFITTPDQIITIEHTALSRDIFALGALRSARFLLTKGIGLYGMEDLLN